LDGRNRQTLGPPPHAVKAAVAQGVSAMRRGTKCLSADAGYVAVAHRAGGRTLYCLKVKQRDYRGRGALPP